MTIEGPYDDLRPPRDPLPRCTLARRTRIATQTRHVVDAAAPKDVLFFPARHDHYAVQAGDGHAAHVAGAAGRVHGCAGPLVGRRRRRHGAPRGHRGLRRRHGAGGEQVRRARIPESVQLVVLVDFENDSVKTALEVARALGPRASTGYASTPREPWWMRAWVPAMGQFDPRGVNPRLVHNVRDALDGGGFESVRIVASGGFGVDKIRAFEAQGVPVDSLRRRFLAGRQPRRLRLHGRHRASPTANPAPRSAEPSSPTLDYRKWSHEDARFLGRRHPGRLHHAARRQALRRTVRKPSSPTSPTLTGFAHANGVRIVGKFGQPRPRPTTNSPTSSGLRRDLSAPLSARHAGPGTHCRDGASRRARRRARGRALSHRPRAPRRTTMATSCSTSTTSTCSPIRMSTRWWDALEIDEVVLYGVALDVCNRYAVEGLLSRHPDIAVTVVTDAVRAIRRGEPGRPARRLASSRGCVRPHRGHRRVSLLHGRRTPASRPPQVVDDQLGAIAGSSLSRRLPRATARGTQVAVEHRGRRA